MSGLLFRELDSPLGPLLLTRTSRGLSGLHLQHGPHAQPIASDWVLDGAAFDDVAYQLQAYFSGSLQAFDVGLDLAGTPFQQAVWRALCGIDYGETLSYSELAGRISRPQAVRAVGAANGRNPVSIIVPCHRVIGADGSLTGYGGGLEAKRFLLALESRQPALV